MSPFNLTKIKITFHTKQETLTDQEVIEVTVVEEWCASTNLTQVRVLIFQQVIIAPNSSLSQSEL